MTHTCSVCSCSYTDDEGGIEGNFGMLPVNFCPTCFSCMCDMAAQYLDIGIDGESNPQHDELIQRLRGHNTVVINAQYGGFGLSRDAQLVYLERSGINYTLVDRQDQLSNKRYGPIILVNGKHWYDKDIKRNDPVLVSLVEELGSRSWGEHAQLKLVKVPAEVEWQIDEYDGREWVSERHRTWN